MISIVFLLGLISADSYTSISYYYGSNDTCADGYYLSDDTSLTQCEICPKGSYCTDGSLYPCPEGSIAELQGMSTCEYCRLHQWSNNGISCGFCDTNQACSYGYKETCEDWTYATQLYDSVKQRFYEICKKCENDGDSKFCEGYTESLKSSSSNQKYLVIFPIAVSLCVIAAVVLVLLLIYRRKSSFLFLRSAASQEDASAVPTLMDQNGQTLFSLSNQQLQNTIMNTNSKDTPIKQGPQLANQESDMSEVDIGSL